MSFAEIVQEAGLYVAAGLCGWAIGLSCWLLWSELLKLLKKDE